MVQPSSSSALWAGGSASVAERQQTRCVAGMWGIRATTVGERIAAMNRTRDSRARSWQEQAGDEARTFTGGQKSPPWRLAQGSSGTRTNLRSEERNPARAEQETQSPRHSRAWGSVQAS